MKKKYQYAVPEILILIHSDRFLMDKINIEL